MSQTIVNIQVSHLQPGHIFVSCGVFKKLQSLLSQNSTKSEFEPTSAIRILKTFVLLMILETVFNPKYSSLFQWFS